MYINRQLATGKGPKSKTEASISILANTTPHHWVATMANGGGANQGVSSSSTSNSGLSQRFWGITCALTDRKLEDSDDGLMVRRSLPVLVVAIASQSSCSQKRVKRHRAALHRGVAPRRMTFVQGLRGARS